MMRNMLLAMDPPRHIEHRRNISPSFRARVIAELAPLFEEDSRLAEREPTVALCLAHSYLATRAPERSIRRAPPTRAPISPKTIS